MVRRGLMFILILFFLAAFAQAQNGGVQTAGDVSFAVPAGHDRSKNSALNGCASVRSKISAFACAGSER